MPSHYRPFAVVTPVVTDVSRDIPDNWSPIVEFVVIGARKRRNLAYQKAEKLQHDMGMTQAASLQRIR